MIETIYGSDLLSQGSIGYSGFGGKVGPANEVKGFGSHARSFLGIPAKLNAQSGRGR